VHPGSSVDKLSSVLIHYRILKVCIHNDKLVFGGRQLLFGLFSRFYKKGQRFSASINCIKTAPDILGKSLLSNY